MSVSQSVSWKTQLWHLFLNRTKMKKMRARDNDMACQCVETSFIATEPMSDFSCLPMPPSSAYDMWYKEQGWRASSHKSWVWTNRSAGVSLIGTKTVSKGRPWETSDWSEHWDEGASLRKDYAFRSASRNNFKETRSCPTLILLCEHPRLLTPEKPIPAGTALKISRENHSLLPVSLFASEDHSSLLFLQILVSVDLRLVKHTLCMSAISDLIFQYHVWQVLGL